MLINWNNDKIMPKTRKPDRFDLIDFSNLLGLKSIRLINLRYGIFFAILPRNNF